MSTKKVYKGVYYHVALAKSPQLPCDVAETLSTHKSVKVRLALARNENTPTEVLNKLKEDISQNVRVSIVLNPSTPLPLLFEIFRTEDLNSIVIWYMTLKMKWFAEGPETYWEEKVRSGEISYMDVRMTHRRWLEYIEMLNQGSKGQEPPNAKFKAFMTLIAKLTMKCTSVPCRKISS